MAYLCQHKHSVSIMLGQRLSNGKNYATVCPDLTCFSLQFTNSAGAC